MPDRRRDGTATSSTSKSGPETLLKTNLGELAAGDRVNLERSLRVGDRLGGHFVQGHVDAVGSIDRRDRNGDWEDVWFRCPAELTRLMVPKGSIAVDGISLTLVNVESERFSVMLIPHTQAVTTLGFKKPGDAVNLEADMLAKHVAQAPREIMADQPVPNPRQTLSYIKGLLASRRLTPKNKMGQNFLIDLNLVDLVVRAAELTKEDCVLEVGTGTGGLTARMADRAGGVFTVELEYELFDMARQSLVCLAERPPAARRRPGGQERG